MDLPQDIWNLIIDNNGDTFKRLFLLNKQIHSYINKIKPKFILHHPKYPLILFKQTPTFYIVTYIEKQCYKFFTLEMFSNKKLHKYHLHMKDPVKLNDFTFKILNFSTLFTSFALFVKVNYILTFIFLIGTSIPDYDIQKINCVSCKEVKVDICEIYY
jgi:hypothetical protein